jgi:hypothetical protein
MSASVLGDSNVSYCGRPECTVPRASTAVLSRPRIFGVSAYLLPNRYDGTLTLEVGVLGRVNWQQASACSLSGGRRFAFTPAAGFLGIRRVGWNVWDVHTSGRIACVIY